MSDNVSKPSHYEGTYGIECIAAIQNALTPEEFRGYCKGCAMKYLWREQGKGKTEDLKKAHMYLDFLILSQPEKFELRSCVYCRHHRLKRCCDTIEDWCDWMNSWVCPDNHDDCPNFERKDNDEQE